MQTLVTVEGEERLVMTNDVSNITSAGTMTRTFSFSKEGIEEVKQRNITIQFFDENFSLFRLSSLRNKMCAAKEFTQENVKKVFISVMHCSE